MGDLLNLEYRYLLTKDINDQRSYTRQEQDTAIPPKSQARTRQILQSIHSPPVNAPAI